MVDCSTTRNTEHEPQKIARARLPSPLHLFVDTPWVTTFPGVSKVGKNFVVHHRDATLVGITATCTYIRSCMYVQGLV